MILTDIFTAAAPETGKEYLEKMYRFAATLALRYWAENNCFESHIRDIRTQFVSTDSLDIKNKILGLFMAYLDQVKGITVFDTEEFGEEDDDLNEEDPSSSYSAKNYQIVSLFRQTSLVTIFEVILETFKSLASAYTTNPEGFAKMSDILSHCLVLQLTPLKHSSNQMVRKGHKPTTLSFSLLTGTSLRKLKCS